ncbi:MAG: PhoH family protein [Acutalibacteraceae bacterium]|nr:MAG: phosphate starvation-inducible protein PhoH [Firmicutes bacterium CAG:552_39_19]
MKTIKLSAEAITKLFGAYDENVKFIEKELGVTIRTSEDGLSISGDNEEKAAALIDSAAKMLASNKEVDKAFLRRAIDLINDGQQEEITVLSSNVVAVTNKGKQIFCKTIGQREYVKAIRNKTIVFGVGPAGTGKTYLAVALAVSAFKAGEVEKIILTRPAIEAGEKLGFLPGDLQTKVDPYLRPLYDALQEMFGIDSYTKLIERGIIEIAPLAYMRGRTLSSSFIILDEAQNTTGEQMKMFLTRLGENSKMVITGDDTQVDLPYGKTSGLSSATKILSGIDEIGIIRLTEKDVVRHELVQKIVIAYEKAAKKEE